MSIGTGRSQLNSSPSVAAGSVTLAKLEQRARPWANWVLNGGMVLAQRQNAGTFTTVAQDKYAADRFRTCAENADVQYVRTDTITSPEVGLSARYYGSWKKITNAGKIAIFQPVESVNSFPLAGSSRTVTFQFKAKVSTGSITFRFGLLKFTGVADTLPASFVTTWFSGGTDPTWGTNLTTDFSSSASIGTSWANYSVTGTLSSTSVKNIVPAIWSDGQLSTNVSISVGEVGLYDGNQTRNWLPSCGELLADKVDCFRFYEKSHPVDTLPGTASSGSTHLMLPYTAAVGNGVILGQVIFVVRKRGTPSVSTWGYLGGSNKVSDAGGIADLAANSGAVLAPSDRSFDVQNNSGGNITPASGGFAVHWAADAEL
jgi:hypothetical protein